MFRVRAATAKRGRVGGWPGLSCGCGGPTLCWTRRAFCDAASKAWALLGLNFTYYPNGNVQNQTISAPNFTATQTYGYDALNRLTSATEANGWFQTFGYDRYGNQWISGHNLPASVVNSLTPTADTWFNPLNNRITGFNYDAGGWPIGVWVAHSLLDAARFLRRGRQRVGARDGDSVCTESG